jgi:hypothetical protein
MAFQHVEGRCAIVAVRPHLVRATGQMPQPDPVFFAGLIKRSTASL